MTNNFAFNSLDEQFKPYINIILDEMKNLHWQPMVAEGKRTLAKQKEKIAAGNSQTKHSLHLAGFAADIIDKRYAWNIPVVHKFWWDLYRVIKTIKVVNGKLRSGLIWDRHEREAIYESALEKGLKTVDWFCDPAHVELILV